jgi:anti-sigma B factor antagonist
VSDVRTAAMTQKQNADSSSTAETATSCTCVRDGRRFVITVTGDVDLASVREAPLTAALTAYRCDEPVDVVLDLGGVTFLDSSGVSWLMAVRSAAALADRRVRVRASSPAVDKVLDMAGLRRYFPAETRVTERVEDGVSP